MTEGSLQAAIEFLDSWLAYRMGQADIPGLCVAIYSQDTIAFSKAYGYANVEFSERMTTSHLFSVASQSKMFTATAILQLAEQGKLRLDDRIVDHLPWLAKHPDKHFTEITIRQLLSHTAGLVRDTEQADFWELQRSFPGSTELRSSILHTAVVTEPNRALKYSNIGYALVGQIVEAACGQSYVAYMRSHIIEPLGLAATHADYQPSLGRSMATGYSTPFSGQRQVLTVRSSTKTLAAAVGIQTTVEDMCRFAASQFYGNELLLSDQSKKEAQRTQSIVTSGREYGLEFGLGLRAQLINGRRLLGHDGHLTGHLTATFFDPDERIAVAVAANAQDAPSVEITLGVFETLSWFTYNAARPVPRALRRFSTRLRSVTSSVEVVAGTHRMVAIDPDSWRPFNDHEQLERLDSSTLRIVTPDSFLHAGELLRYEFTKGTIRFVRYAGLTMVPETKCDLSSSGWQQTLGDLEHAELRVGRVTRAERLGSRSSYRLVADFGSFGTESCYIRDVPQTIGPRQLIGKSVFGAIFPSWNPDRQTHAIMIIGLSADRANTASPLDGLLALEPDPLRPQILLPREGFKQGLRYSNAAKIGAFKFQALPEYTLDTTDAGSDSLSLWYKGGKQRSIALLDDYRRTSPPYWLKHPHRRYTRIMVIDTEPTPYQQWAIEYEKRVSIPLGETAYLLPSKSLRELAVPEGDFTIWDGKRVTLNGYKGPELTHTHI